MPLKTVVDIDINDRNWQNFARQWRTFQQQVKSTPLSMRPMGQVIAQGAKGFQQIVTEQAAAITQQRMLNEAHRAALRLLDGEASRWQAIGRSTKTAAVNIKDMTTSLLRWSSLTAAFTGLLGAGGLFGISRLAQDVSGGRRSSLGLGVAYGEQSAFQTNFQRVVDPNALLGGVNRALTDTEGRAALYGAGVRDLSGGAAAVSLRVLQSVKGLADKTDSRFLGDVFRARRLGDLGLTPEDFQRIKNTSRGELNSLVGNFGKDVGRFGLSGTDQRAYQEFTTQLSRAGTQIETVFVRGISPLIPGLTKLSDAVADTVKTFLESPKLKEWVDKAGDSLKEFANYVGTDEFKQKVKDFVAAIGTIADKTIAVAGWLGGNTARVGLGTASAVANSGPHAFTGYSADEIASHRARGEVLSPFGFWRKADAGDVDPGLGALGARLQKNIPGIDRFTAFADKYHQGTDSAHNDGRAFDLTVKDAKQAAAVAAAIREELSRLGIAGKVIDEYANPSSRSTAPHIHTQLEKRVDVRIVNAAGSSIVVQSQQVVPPQ